MTIIIEIIVLITIMIIFITRMEENIEKIKKEAVTLNVLVNIRAEGVRHNSHSSQHNLIASPSDHRSRPVRIFWLPN